MLRASSSPMPLCQCSIADVDGKWVLVVEVEPNAGIIYALTVEGEKPEFYVRRGATTFPARAEELQMIFVNDPNRTQSNSMLGLTQ